MTAFEDPALQGFVSEIKTELAFAQLLIRRADTGFELRHAEDLSCSRESLRLVSDNEIRRLAQFSTSGAFRPLKSAPNLPTGWRFVAGDEIMLGFALAQLYPGAVADWFTVKISKAVPTNYREFTRRQTGMYRITAMLTDEQAAPVIRACCHKNFCLKQRLWTVGGLEADLLSEKSLIPCLEPCAILLEFARKAMRLQQLSAEENPSGPVDSETKSEIREADFDNPQNPRRLQLVREKQKINA